MSPCEKYDGLIERMLADEMGHGDRDLLLEHGESCEGCRSFIDLHYRLAEVDFDPDLPSAAEFASMRRRVLEELEDTRRPSWLRWLGFDTVIRPAFAGAMAAVLLLFVFGGGWWLGSAGQTTAVGGEEMIAGMLEEARANRELADAENSPYIYSNVAYQPAEDGRVALRFDVTRHLEIDRPSDDPLVQELLVHSLINPAPVGTRLQALDHVRQSMNPKLKEALIFTLLNDENQAVRMRSLELLGDHTADADIQEALMVVLRGEDSVHLRLMAIDLLAGASTEESFGRVLEELDERDDRAVLMRAASYRPAALPAP